MPTSNINNRNRNSSSSLIINEDEEPKFPYLALGPVLGSTVKEIADIVQCPIAVAGQSVLATASLVSQSFANVEMDGRVYPLSLFALTIASSGDRKTSTDKVALKPVLVHQNNLMKQYEMQQVTYRKQILAYKQAEKNILRELKTDDQTIIEQALDSLNEISVPINPKMICSEPTTEGLQKGFLNGTATQGIFNDEGGQFFSGHSMSNDNKIKTITALSRLWDGSPIDRTRSSNEKDNFYLENRRLTAHFMVQPILANKILNDQELIEQGFLARFLMSAPTSIAGTRLYNCNADTSKSIAIQSYDQLINKLLKTKINIDDRGGLILKSVEPSAAAKMAWTDIYNDIENELGKDGLLFKMRPTANKICENILRIAGVFAIIEQSNEINLRQMKRAIEVGMYYLSSYLWIINQNKNQPTEDRANILYEWLLNSKHLINGNTIQLTTILRNSPRAANARNKNNAIQLMDTLVKNNQLIALNDGNSNEWQIRKQA